MAEDFFNLVRQQEVELPAQVNVIFINKNADYQQGGQASKRTTTKSKEIVTVNLPIVMDDAKAKLVADVLMYTAWVERTKASLSLTRKYAYLEPTDVFTLQRDGAEYTFRILKKDEMADGTIKLEVVADSPSVYLPNTQTGTGSAVVDSNVAEDQQPTRLTMGNFPLLQPSNDVPTWYVAACGVASNWAGAGFYKSSDGGQTYFRIGSTSTPAVVGFVTKVLGAGEGTNMVQYGDYMDVVLYYGELSSTNMQAMVAGANSAMVGDELIQFLNAELIATNTYRLTGLLRGRRGTEWAAGFHSYGEGFTLLNINGSITPVPTNINELNANAIYKAVTFNMSLDSGAPRSFAYRGVDRKPYAPTMLRGERNTSLDLTAYWTRRSRIANTWVSNGNIPLGETTEAYELHVLSATIRTISTITTGTTTTIKTSVAHSFVTGDSVYLGDIIGLSVLTDRTLPVTVISTTEFTVPVDTTNQGAYTSGGTARKVLRIISSVVQNAVYLATEQTTDFGSAQASIAVRIFQISAAVGRGYSVGGSI